MAFAKVFRSGKDQFVRLPMEFRFRSEEVEVFRRGKEVVLREKTRSLERAFWLLADLPIDVDAVERARNERPQKRKRASSPVSPR